jgi:hypothetical protein
MVRPRLRDDRGALERALNGTYEPLPEDLRVALCGKPGVFRAVRHTVRVILYNRHRRGSVGAVDVFDLVKGLSAYNIVRAAHWYVRRRVEYWGIDPKVEGFCTKCRQKKPLEEFPVVSRCASCVKSRNG